MYFPFFIAGLIITTVVTASAQPSRERLEGLNGVRFGMTIEEARKALGGKAKDEESKLNDGKSAKGLRANIKIGDAQYRTLFKFSSNDRLVSIIATPNAIYNKGDKDHLSKEVCEKNGASMVQAVVKRYGKPDLEDKGPDGRVLKFNFTDGNQIVVVTRFISIACIAFVNFATPAERI